MGWVVRDSASNKLQGTMVLSRDILSFFLLFFERSRCEEMNEWFTLFGSALKRARQPYDSLLSVRQATPCVKMVPMPSTPLPVVMQCKRRLPTVTGLHIFGVKHQTNMLFALWRFSVLTTDLKSIN